MPLSPSGYKHWGNLCQWAANQFLETVSSCAGQKHNQAKDNSTSAYAVAPFTPQIILYVHKNCHCREWAYADEEKEPVEEVGHLIPLLWVRVIELVGPESRDTRFEPSSA